MTKFYTGEMGGKIRMIQHDLFFIFKPKCPIYLAVSEALLGGSRD
tara:strand:+ start:12007 stop:12141 length:135 start_codon:yes stop_codon:yes gene_type:complete